jgi:phosphotriesterase-related protein
MSGRDGLAAPFVRTVLGDIAPAELGATDAHEHLIIDGGRMVESSPDFLLADVDKAVEEVSEAARSGLGAVIDAMPCDLGRSGRKLAEISRRTGVHVVAATGLHLASWYPAEHWGNIGAVEVLTERFRTEIADGLRDGNGPAPHRAGVIKVAGSVARLSDRDRRAFQAAAAAHRLTGCPILTHCTDGTAAPEQVALLIDAGVAPGTVTLSHTDKVVDRGYHRDLLSTGVNVEYDQAFRWPTDGDNGTLTLLDWMLEDGYGAQLMVGLDAARQGYWRAYGGRPGLAFLLGDLALMMDGRGIVADARRRIFVDNPARAFAFRAQEA